MNRALVLLFPSFRHGLILLLCCTFAPPLIGGAQSLEPAGQTVAVREHLNVECGRGGEQVLKLDVFQPRDQEAASVPAILVIHGGAWRGGTKESMHGICELTRNEGCVAVAVQYRLCPQHPFPAQIEDVKCAVRFLKAHAGDYGIDAERIGAVGFSAGAHLSLMLGTLNEQDGFHGTGGWADQTDQIQAVAAFFGPTDLTATNIPEVSRPLLSDFLGEPASNQSNSARQASPLTWVSPGDAPTLIFHGTTDHLVPYDQAWKFAEAMHAHQIPGRVEILPGLGHGWGGAERDRTLQAAFDFLMKHLNRKPAASGRSGANLNHRLNRRYLPVAATLPMADPNDEETETGAAGHAETIVLFDGKSLDAWEGNRDVFRLEDGAVVGGQLKERIPHNEFLATRESWQDFELTLEFKLLGERTNAGIQIRSERIPDHHEMIGYQADLGQNYWGSLYDESRRRKILAAADPEIIAEVLRREDWNRYRIVCKGPRIQLWINGEQTVDYTETDPQIPLTGRIALQIHGGPPGEAWYRNIRLTPLTD